MIADDDRPAGPRCAADFSRAAVVKRVVLTSGGLAEASVDALQPGADEVLIGVDAAGFNPSDVHFRDEAGTEDLPRVLGGGGPPVRSSPWDRRCAASHPATSSAALDADPERWRWYGESMDRLTTLYDAELLRPPVIKCVGELSAATVDEPHQRLRTRRAHGKLVMAVRAPAP